MSLFSVRNCLWNMSERALERAYIASKKIRKIQKDYLFYKKQSSWKHSWHTVSLYMDFMLNQSLFQIYWNLFILKCYQYFINTISNIFYFFNTDNIFLNKSNSKRKSDIFPEYIKSSSTKKDLHINTNQSFQDDYTDSNNLIKEEIPYKSKKDLLTHYFIGLKQSNSKSYFTQQISSIIKHLQNYLLFSELKNNTVLNINAFSRKIAWIEATLIDFEILKKQCWQPINFLEKEKLKYNIFLPFFFLKTTPKTIAYESVGLVPRSITRTLSRFQSELAGRSASLVLPEFKLAKYQAVASLQYMICLIIFPWLFSLLFQTFLFKPLVENWWNTRQSQVFLNISQEQKALTRLQDIEELVWLDMVISSPQILTSHQYSTEKDLSSQIHKKTVELVNLYNYQSIDTILHIFTNLISLTIIGLLLTLGKKRLAILSSWVQELFYSLSDTMKAFLILLFTDLCIGFHSPHGWEILIDLLLEHLGFSYNKHVISCFVSTFPVILDTVFKYWIFRHLNRISPSIVVTYHTMNE